MTTIKVINFFQQFHYIKPIRGQDMLLVKKIMEYSPFKRLTAAEAIQHPYFEELKDPDNLKTLKKCPFFPSFVNNAQKV